MPRKSYLKETIRLGLGAAKANILPGSFLWAIGIALVVLYYQVEPVTSFFNEVGVLKEAYSPWIGMLSTAFFGSLVPWIVTSLSGKKLNETDKKGLAFLFVFWALQGFQVDILYRLQDSMFGSNIDFQTIACKALVDEFVWVPFFAIPQIVTCYLAVENSLSLEKMRAALKRKNFLQRAIPLMIANWIVWIPTCSLVYLFPLPLQLPLMNIVLCIWCLIIAFFSKEE